MNDTYSSPPVQVVLLVLQEAEELNKNDLKQPVLNELVEAITIRNNSSDPAKEFKLQTSTDYSTVIQLTRPQEEIGSVRNPETTRSMDTQSHSFPVIKLKRSNPHLKKARVLAHEPTNPQIPKPLNSRPISSMFPTFSRSSPTRVRRKPIPRPKKPHQTAMNQ